MASIRTQNTPRVLIPVTFMEDPSYTAVMTRSSRGPVAWGVFCSLLVFARKHHNGGDALPQTIPVVARCIFISERVLRKSIELIRLACEENGCDAWITIEDGRIVIPRLSEYMPDGMATRGGRRDGAGRPPKRDDDCEDEEHSDSNLSEFKANSNPYSNGYSNRIQKESNGIQTLKGTGTGSGSGSGSGIQTEIKANSNLNSNGIQSEFKPEIKANSNGYSNGNSNRIQTEIKDRSKPHSNGVRADFDALWSCVPERLRKSKPQVRDGFDDAIARGRDPAFIIERCRDYYASAEGRSEFARHPRTFFNSEIYDEDDAAWAVAEKTREVDALDRMIERESA